jgi:hypothetical protein
MIHDPKTLQAIIAFCTGKWLEARDQLSVIPVQDADIQTGKKMAYNDVLQHARLLLEES